MISDAWRSHRRAQWCHQCQKNSSQTNTAVSHSVKIRLVLKYRSEINPKHKHGQFKGEDILFGIIYSRLGAGTSCDEIACCAGSLRSKPETVRLPA